MIADLISDLFRRIGHTWTLVNKPGVVYSGPKFIVPSSEDVQQVLDEAAKRLYDGDVGDRLTTGGLIIEKTADGYDAYVFVGNYEGE